MFLVGAELVELEAAFAVAVWLRVRLSVFVI